MLQPGVILAVRCACSIDLREPYLHAFAPRTGKRASLLDPAPPATTCNPAGAHTQRPAAEEIPEAAAAPATSCRTRAPRKSDTVLAAHAGEASVSEVLDTGKPRPACGKAAGSGGCCFPSPHRRHGKTGATASVTATEVAESPVAAKCSGGHPVGLPVRRSSPPPAARRARPRTNRPSCSCWIPTC